MGMWGRKEPEEPTKPAEPVKREAATTKPEPAVPAAPSKGAVVNPQRAVIGPSISVKGELIGDEDLVVEGKVEGVVRLKQHHLVIGTSAEIDATLEAKSIRIEGQVRGDVVATERVELAAGSALTGDITAPRMVIADGARFKGSVDMGGGDAGRTTQPNASQKTASSSKPAEQDKKPVGVS
jgi:cytoskeletal protein CcmA (bactofilin family)